MNVTCRVVDANGKVLSGPPLEEGVPLVQTLVATSVSDNKPAVCHFTNREPVMLPAAKKGGIRRAPSKKQKQKQRAKAKQARKARRKNRR